jgi:hypothetical protein
MPVQAGKRHDDPVHEAVDHQRVADAREPGMVEQCGKLPARRIEDGGRRKRNQEMEGQAERACCPAVLKGYPPKQTARDALQQAHWMNMIGNPGQQEGCGDVHNAAEKSGDEDCGKRTRSGRSLYMVGRRHLALD